MPEIYLNDNYTDIGHLKELTESDQNKKKKHHAVKHFNYFMRQTRSIRFNHISVMNMSDVTDEIADIFATYMACYARFGCRVDRPLLSYLTSYGYLSAWKMYFVTKYKYETLNPVFGKDNWGTYLRAIYKEKSCQARAEGKVIKCRIYTLNLDKDN